MNALETQVLRLIGENVATPDVFTDDATGLAQIRGSINDAIQEICMVSGSYRRTYHMALLAGRNFYRIAPRNDYLGYIVGVFDRHRKRRLVRTDLLSLQTYDGWWLKRTGPALQYMMLGDYFVVYMAPSTKGIVLEMDCVMIPRPYTDEKDPVKVRTQFQNATVYYAISEFYASRGDAKRATEYHTRYIETAGLISMSPLAAETQYRLGGSDKDSTVEVTA